jgi:hypothetical protein
MSMFRREPVIEPDDEPNRGGLVIPADLRREVHPRQEDTGPAVYAPPRSRPGADARVVELQRALAPRLAAPPPPLSEEARKLVSQQDISRAEAVRDSQRAMAAARLAEFDAWVKIRIEEMIAEGAAFNKWAEERRAFLVDFSDRVYAWGDDHVAKVVAEQEERARLHHRDVDIVLSTQALLEKHGVPLPPPKAATTDAEKSDVAENLDEPA